MTTSEKTAERRRRRRMRRSGDGVGEGARGDGVGRGGWERHGDGIREEEELSRRISWPTEAGAVSSRKKGLP